MEDLDHIRNKIINYYMDNPSLTEDLDYEDDDVRLESYTEWVYGMSEEELREHYQLMIDEDYFSEDKATSNSPKTIKFYGEHLNDIQATLMKFNAYYKLINHSDKKEHDFRDFNRALNFAINDLNLKMLPPF